MVRSFAQQPAVNGGISEELTKPVKRLAYYEAKRIFEDTQIRREVILSGPRRVGKTTIMYQLIGDYLHQGIPPKNIIYVSFDHPMLKLCDIGRIRDIYINNLALDDNPAYRMMATGSASPI